MNRVYKMLAIIFTHTVAFLVGYVLAVETEECVQKAKAEKEKKDLEKLRNATSSIFKTDRKHFVSSEHILRDKDEYEKYLKKMDERVRERFRETWS